MKHLYSCSMLLYRLIGLVALVLLVSCGTSKGEERESGASTGDARSQPTEVVDNLAYAAATTTPASEATMPEETPNLPATVVAHDGQTITVESIERIVSLNGDITEIIFALELGDHLVGVDSSATYPPDRVRDIANIGYQRRLNAEGILALNPTLVIGNEHAGPPDVLAQIRSAGVPVAIVANTPTLDSPVHKMTFVAQALGVPERGASLIAQLETDIADAQTALDQASGAPPRVLFIYLRGSDVQLIAGSDTPADTMITAAGGINVGAEAGLTDFQPLSPEIVVAAQPDVLLLPENGLQSAGGLDGLLSMQGIANTPAAQERWVVAMDDLYLLGMGPRTGQALHELVTLLHTPPQEETY